MCDLDVYKQLKKMGFVFSTTPKKGSSFIFSNGLFLNLRDNTHKLTKWNYQDAYPHILINSWLNKIEPQLDCYKLRDQFNVIQICDAANFDFERVYIWLPPQKITYQQEQSLMNWILFVSNMTSTLQCIRDNEKPWWYQLISLSHSEGLTPEEIIKNIRFGYNK